jgi:hypothetical protein
MHGKPLSENIKNILLKHLDTAPKEILGDFPRIGRENASKMIAQTHIKLCEEFNIPLPESEKSSKIPALLDMKVKAPTESFHDSRKEQSSRSSRWLNRENDSPKKQMSPAASSTSTGPGDALLSDMRGILSDKQIESMAAIGVKTVNHINNLTVAQLNDIGLSLATIGEIQATAINMHNNIGSSTRNEASSSPKPPNSEDVDMRVYPKQESTIKSPDTIMSPNQSDAEVQEIYKKPAEVPPPQTQTMMSPPVDYSQYLRDSNLNNDNDENEDEPGLKIDETYGSDYEIEEKKDSQSEDDAHSSSEPSNSLSIQLLPPSIIDTSAFLKATPAKVDISSSIQQQLMEKEKPVSREPRSRDPRMASQAKPIETIPEISSPTYRDPRQQTNPETPRRTSIYEIESPSEDEDIQIKLSKDKDMRMPPFMNSENGDVDFRFPFTPMANYVPATEIEASYGTYNFEKYEVKIVDIPRPDYSDIRRSFRQSEHSQDPRLKKLCNAKADSEKEEQQLANITLPSDPRKRKVQEAKSEPILAPKKLQISTILQNSKHYNELSSSQKMVVNDVLAELSKQLKLFHADQSPSKVFDTTFITNNPRLQQILIGLGVFVNAEGEFEEIKEFPLQAQPPPVVNLPNIHQMPPTIVPSIFNQPPPANLMLQPPPNFLATPPNLVRPGILGMAPPTFFEPDAFGALNQPPPFANNDQMNFNRNQRQQQPSGNNNSFRNNNSQRNSGNNYRNNRR